MDTLERSNRTWLCTVLFLDIVGYSRKSVTQQFDMKECLNRCISQAITQVSSNDRIILDTGDGAALCFTGDPEDALFVALSLREALHTHPQPQAPSLKVRIGVNLGPVKIVRDINAQMNIIGDGINVAQRVMTFAAPNQILVSRSFYEVISCLSQEYARLFSYRGLRKDKHVREHAVYEVMGHRRAHPSLASDLYEEGAHTASEDATPVDRGIPLFEAAPPWDPEMLQTVQHHLALYIGPIAKLLVTQAAKQVSDVNELYQMLAGHISDEPEKERFLKGATLSRPPTVPDPAHQDEGGSIPSVPSESGPTWQPRVLQAAVDHLVKYLGPVAKILVQREAKKTNNVEELYHLLAEHISIDAEKKRFLRDVISH